MFTDRSAAGVRRQGKVLVTGGRAPAALELMRLLHDAGWEVYSAESARRHLSRVSRAVFRSYAVPSPAANPQAYADRLEDIVRREGIELLIPTCEEIYYVAAARKPLSRLCQVFSPPLEQLRRLHSKWAFIRRAEELGLTVPATRRIASREQWEEWIRLAAAGRVADAGFRELQAGFVLKPEFSRFSTQVRIVSSTTDGEAVARELRQCAELAARQKDAVWIAQQLIRGSGLCSYSIAHEGELAAHAVYRSRYTAGRGATVHFEPLKHEGILAWVRRFVKAERFTGQIAFDFIETEEGGLYPIECNPRLTSGIHLFTSGDGLDRAFADTYRPVGGTIEPNSRARAMLALPMLLFGWQSAPGWRGKLRWLGHFASARDTVFRWNDMRPFMEQLAVLKELRASAAAGRISLLEASTADIEWNGGSL